ncbi:MAG: ABC transporter permease [Hyphomonadaceae bacterium]|jgi:ABC-2 type transport system permease protein|nr:ABC transporter permease [Hyphomonadaceae bacterium]
MFALIGSEFAKLKRTLVPLVCIAAPLCAATFTLLFVLRLRGGEQWLNLLGEGAATWAFFLLPMSITALTILLAQIEHAPKMWTHLLSLPAPRSTIFAAKVVVAFGLTGVMSVIGYALIYAALWLGEFVKPGVQLVGDAQFDELALAFALMAAGAGLMIVVQLWAALRFRGFAIPLVMGIVGTFAALALASSVRGVLLPWFIPTYVLTLQQPSSQIAIWFGAVGGVVAAVAMVFHLGRQERFD